MSTTDDLAAWLRARLDEDEAFAERLRQQAQEVRQELKDPALLGKPMPGWGLWPEVERMAAGVLAGIAAKRRILELHQPVVGLEGMICGTCREPDYPHEAVWLHPCPTLRELASAYEDRSGYREEWRSR